MMPFYSRWWLHDFKQLKSTKLSNKCDCLYYIVRYISEIPNNVLANILSTLILGNLRQGKCWGLFSAQSLLLFQDPRNSNILNIHQSSLQASLRLFLEDLIWVLLQKGILLYVLNYGQNIINQFSNREYDLRKMRTLHSKPAIGVRAMRESLFMFSSSTSLLV